MKYNTEPLKRARQLKRLTYTQVAAEIGLSENMVRKIENGLRNPGEKTIFKLSELLEIPMDQLLPKRGRRTA